MDDLRWRSGWILLVFLIQNGVNLAECRPVAVESENGDSPAASAVGLLTKDGKLNHNLVLGLLVTIATLISLMIALVLCTCADKPERNELDKPATNNGEVAVEDNVAPVSPSPDALTVPAPDSTSPAVQADNAVKLRAASVQSASSPTPGHTDDPLIRCSTIERRLPELPPTPMPPVTPTNEDEEDDYNRTYDVIGETKTDAGVTKVETKKESPPEEDIEDEQYASVSDSAAGKLSLGVKLDPTSDTSAAEGGVEDEEDCDEPYAVVRAPDTDDKVTGSVPYASVGSDKDDKEGYSRLRTIHKRPREESPEGGEKNGYARLRDLAVDGAMADGAVGGAVGGAAAKEEDEEVPPVPYKPPDLQNEDEESNSLIPSVGAAASAAANDVAASGDGNAPAPSKKREPPYTQVSARESLEVVRARQQAEQSARMAAHYQTIEEDQNLDADHDGIYEPVDDQQLDCQMVMAPPPLPGDRQGPSNAPSASNNWQITRAPRVYEEITDETRPRPPNTLAAAANASVENDDDIEPYAVTEKRPSPAEAPLYTAVNKKTKANYAKVNKAAKTPDQANNNAGAEIRSADLGPPSPVPTDEAGLPLYAVVDKKGKGREPAAKKEEATVLAWDDRTVTPHDNAYQTVENNYQTVPDMSGSNGEVKAAAVAGGMVLASDRNTPNDLWTKKEHMYIDVETNQPSTPPPVPADQRSPGAPRTNHSYESVEVTSKSVSKKEKQKQAKKEAKMAKKEAKRERKHSKGGKEKGQGGKDKDKEKGEEGKETTGKETVWRRQDSLEPNVNGNSNNNTDPFGDYESVAFPLQETRL